MAAADGATSARPAPSRPAGAPRPRRARSGPSRGVSLLLAVAAGACLWAAFPDAGWWPAAFVGVGLLWAALQGEGPRAAGRNLLVGLAAGLTFWFPHIWWANIATDTVPWVALSVMEALFLAGFGVLWTGVRRLPLLRPARPGASRARRIGGPVAHAAAFALVFVAVEQWRSEMPFGGFPWGRLAWAMVDAPTGRAAWLGGTTLVTFLVAFVGVLLALAVARVIAAVTARRRGAQDAHGDPADAAATGPGAKGSATHGVSAGVLVAVAAVAALFPALLPLPAGDDPAAPVATADLDTRTVDADVATHEGPGPVLRVGAVQGNVAEPGLGSFANRAEVLNNHLEGTYALAQRDADLDVVLWPENGSDLDPQEVPEVATALDDAAEAVGAPILVGAQEFPATGGRYNVSLLWQAGEGVTGRYAKQHPAPFGEYIPLRSFVRIFSAEVDRVTNDMLPGTEPAVIDLPRADGPAVPMATVICFEVAYDEIVRDAVQRGAQVLVVPTNNASFGYSAESTQQLQMTRMQAMTTGRAAVQVSTVGVSGVVAPDGTLVASTDLFTADEIVAELPLRTTLTPAVRAGYWPGWLAGVAAAALVVAGFASGLRSRRLEEDA
ncbi:apolipoprotein N-acyltransferase [Isoptericola jiangsuensis]|uniref:Apolipoprotein N-acyltransferase n=1 Tax=Isoptericola jiangsuensis TaxID=548579 RepID=A0A2A9EYG2_9MICO|nr:apolipoprotein N-acyltransferase [Isoptericola jiangsuensis]PFG43199.1 apolipoprotein N-acyltransferase [Isoptericola jiangsuensis]